MLEAIEKKTIASAASCDAMLRMMRAQQAGAAAAQSLLIRPRRAQDRRLPAGAGQRRRHHLRALGTDRRVVPRQRHHRQLRRGRRSDWPLRAATSGATSINEDVAFRHSDYLLCVSVSLWLRPSSAQEPPLWPGAKYDPAIPTHQVGARPRPRRGDHAARRRGAVPAGAAEGRAHQVAADRIRAHVGRPAAVAVRDRQPRSHREARSGQGRPAALRRSAPHVRRPTPIGSRASCRWWCG